MTGPGANEVRCGSVSSLDALCSVHRNSGRHVGPGAGRSRRELAVGDERDLYHSPAPSPYGRRVLPRNRRVERRQLRRRMGRVLLLGRVAGGLRVHHLPVSFRWESRARFRQTPAGRSGRHRPGPAGAQRLQVECAQCRRAGHRAAEELAGRRETLSGARDARWQGQEATSTDTGSPLSANALYREFNKGEKAALERPWFSCSGISGRSPASTKGRSSASGTPAASGARRHSVGTPFSVWYS